MPIAVLDRHRRQNPISSRPPCLVLPVSAEPKQARDLIPPQIIGFHFRQASPASFCISPAIVSGTGPNASGITFAISASRRTFHFEKPPIIGDLIAKTTRDILVSRIGKAHITHGSTFEQRVQRDRSLRPSPCCA